MRRTRFDRAACPVARTADLLADWWTPIIMRDLLLGVHRFSEIQANNDIPKAVLSQRLKRLEVDEVIERRQYQEHPPRSEYHLTEKGRALWDVIATMWQFGDDWMFETSPGAELELVDRHSGDPISVAVVDGATGQPIELRNTRIRRRRSPGTRLAE